MWGFYGFSGGAQPQLFSVVGARRPGRGAGWNYWLIPLPYPRRAGRTALDGKPQFDLNQFNQAYFDRMRERILLWASEASTFRSCSSTAGASRASLVAMIPGGGTPTTGATTATGLTATATITARAKRPTRWPVGDHGVAGSVCAQGGGYLNDLDNVLYEISNESPGNSQDWQYHMINLIKGYEATKPNSIRWG